MEEVQIATLVVLSVSVITALVFGISSLRQTKDIQKKQYSHMLLQEVINWTEKVAELGITQRVRGVSWDETNTWPFLANQHKKLQTDFQPLRIKAVYIENIARVHFPSLNEAIANVVKMLSAQIKSLYKYDDWDIRWKENKEPPDPKDLYEMAEEVADNNKRLYNVAIKAIKLTTEKMAELIS